MSRDPLTRMDVDTNWAYHRKVRMLQARYPQQWTTYWCAYQALLGEAWAKGNRKLTLEQTWCPALPCTAAEALAALKACDVVDRAGRVPLDSWREWVEPAMARMKKSSDAGQRAAHKRWHVGEFERCQLCADAMQGAMRSHSDGNAPRQPRQPTIPTNESKNGRRTERRGRMTRVGDVLAGELDPAVGAGMALLESKR